jgi:hypothetical protein
MEKTTTSTILHFHTGRGGRYYNGGHTTFRGVRDILDVLDYCGDDIFTKFENEAAIFNKLDSDKHPNLIALFEDCKCAEDFTDFERRTGLKLGEKYYTDTSGQLLISEAEAADGVGRLNFDGQYDTDTCIYLHECGENDLKIILESNEYNNEDLVKEYFDNHTDLSVDWSKFDGDFSELIRAYFNDAILDIANFYNEEENN